MNSTTITTHSTKKFNKILSLLTTLHPHLPILPSPTTNSTLQSNLLLSHLTNLLHLKPLHPSYALAA